MIPNLHTPRRLAVLTCLGLFLLSAVAQTPAPPTESAAKYHAALLKRPSGGYLFDRFYTAWLDGDTAEGLRAFLESRIAGANAQTADRLLLAYFFVRQSQDEEALRVFGEALAADPANPEAWLEQAKLQARLLDFAAAVRSLDRALEAQPKADLAAEIAQLRGRMLTRAGNVEEGVKAWEELLAAHPDDLDLHEDLVELLLAEGLVDQALASCQKLVEKTKDPYQQVIRRMQLGDIYQRAGRRQEAIDTYTANLTASGNDSWVEKEVLRQLGQVYRRDDDLAGWRKQLEGLIAAHPQRIALQERLAALAAEMNDPDAAIATYASLLKLTPGDRARREAFVALLSQLKKPREAAEQMRELVALHPDDSGLLAQLAVLQQEAGDTAAARASVLASLEKSAKAEYDYLRAGRLLEEFKDPGAGEIYAKLLAAFPESIAAQETQAAYLYRTGRQKEALALWKSIAAKGSSQDVIRAAQFLGPRGEKKAAYEILSARAEEFQADFVYLGQLGAAALEVEKFAEAVPWMEKRLRLATSPGELQEAIRQASVILGRIEDATGYREKLRQRADRSVAESCLLAEMLEQAGDFQAAENALKPFLDQGDALGLGQWVRILEQRGHPEQAAEAMARLIAQPGERTSSNLQRLVSLRRRALQTEAALRAVEEWRQLAPASSMPWREEASILLETGRTQDAIAVLRRAVQRFEGQIDVRIALANAYAEEGKIADAERIYWSLYEESEDLGGKLSWVRNLARLAQQSGQVDALVEEFEQRRRTNRESIEPLLALAEIHRQSRNHEELRKVLVEATRMRPEDVTLIHEIARSEEEEGDWKKSLETLRAAAVLDRTDSTRRRMARLQLLWGDEEEGLRMLMDLSGGPDAAAVAGMADALILNGGWERVANFLATQTGQFPRDYRLVYLRAIALEESGQTEAARDEFLRLLEWPHELPAAPGTTTTTTRSANAYYGEFPPQTFELANLQGAIRSAYYYDQQLRYLRQSTRALSRSTAGSTIVMLPTSLLSLRQFSLAHLRGLASQMEEDQVTDLVARLRQQGVDHAEDLTLFRFSRYTDSGQTEDAITDQILEKYPDNAYLQAKGVAASWSHNTPSIFPIERTRQAYLTLAKDYPNLAMLSALTAAASGHDKAPKGHMLLDLALRDGRVTAKPSLYVRQAIVRALKPNVALDPAFRKTLVELTLKWHADPQLAQTGSTRFDIFDPLAPVLAAEDDPTPFLTFCAGEIRDFRANPKLSVQAMARLQSIMPSIRGQANLLTPLAMPPAELPNIPPNVLLTFKHELPRLSGMDQFADPTRLAAKLDLVTDPSLKFIIAALGNREDVAETFISQWLAPESRTQPLVAEYMLVAAYRGLHDDAAGAAEALDIARQWPMPKMLRQRLDAALACYVVKAGEKASEAVKTAGRQALLRLRYSASSPQDREALAGAMRELGLTKEAELLAAQNARAGRLSSNTLSSLFSGTRAVIDDRSQIMTLLNSGQKDKAIPLLVNHLRRAAKSMLAPGAGSSLDFNALSLVGQATRTVSVAEIMTELGEPKTPAEKQERAAILELLGEKQQAIAAYEEALAAGSGHDGLRLRVVVLKGSLNPEEGAAALVQLDPNLVHHLGDYMASLLDGARYGRGAQLDLTYNLAAMISLWLEQMDAATAAKLRIDWMRYPLLQYLQRSESIGFDTLDALFTRDGKGADEEIWNRRLEVHQRLCRSMIPVPCLARRGFMDYATLAVPMAKTPEDWADLDQKARQALAARQIELQSNTRLIMQDNSSRYYPEWSPEDYLIKRAWQKSGAAGKAEAEAIVQEIELWAPRDIRASTRAYFDLWFGDATAFYAAAGLYDDAFLSQSLFRADPRAAARAEQVYEAWQARRDTIGGAADFREFTLAQARKNRQGAVSWCADFCLTDLVQTGDFEGAQKFLEELTLARLGPREGWDQFVPRQNNHITISGQRVILRANGYHDPGHQGFADYLIRGVKNEVTAFPVLEFLQREGLDDNNHYSSQSLPTELIYDSSPDIPQLLSLLRYGPLREGVGLPVLTLAKDRRFCLLRSLLERLKATKAAGEEARTALLAELKPRRDLAAALTVAYFGSEKPAAEIFDQVGKHRAEIEAFGPEDWEGLSLFLEPVLPGWRDADVSPDAREILQKITDMREGKQVK